MGLGRLRALALANALGWLSFRLRHPKARSFHHQANYLEERTDGPGHVDEVEHSEEVVGVASQGGSKGHNTLAVGVPE